MDFCLRSLPGEERLHSKVSLLYKFTRLSQSLKLLNNSLFPQVLLDKSKQARTVVNKPGMIENKYRNIEFELLAGEEDFVATVSEHRCKFQFDFSKVS